MSALVTGDAVVLGLQSAKLPSRALAIVIDLVVVWAAYLFISIGLAVATASLDEAAVMAVSIASFLLVLVGAPIAVETLSHGRSLGKLACGLRVVRDDGGPIRFRHALVRGAMGVVEILMSFGVIACIASLVSARGRRIGDVFAGTLVVRERVPAARGNVLPPPPPWLVGRFTELDLSAVPDHLWLAIRQFLTRMRQLDPAVSWSMAERLASDLAERTGAPTPQGVPPAAYLAAVVNERQARDARRAFGAGGVGGAPMTGTGQMQAAAPGFGSPATGASGGAGAAAAGAAMGNTVSPGAGWTGGGSEAAGSQATPVALGPAKEVGPRIPTGPTRGAGDRADGGAPRSTGFAPPA
ncbi:RDD family protein [Streptomyces sp. NBC_00306]|uniref:RDD family protein n=1 Tax=Streptomyces sp. NBC_00306 TaxID=2975708 RepID=UPI002E2AFC5C|nr:RDD family protein [Streptomyces sp. NBC_00306]